jgi:hypothetical protein
MANRTRKAIGMAVAAALMSVRPALGDEPNTFPVAVRIYNYSTAPAADLSYAKAEAARVFERAGLEIRWQDHGISAVSLVILPREMAEKKAAEEGIPGTVLGRAAAATGRAYAFYDRIVSIAVRRRVDARALLATVVAHELGHVLLGEASHSAEGIMSADLDPMRSARKGFTTAQAAAMRARLNATLSAAR